VGWLGSFRTLRIRPDRQADPPAKPSWDSGTAHRSLCTLGHVSSTAPRPLASTWQKLPVSVVRAANRALQLFDMTLRRQLEEQLEELVNQTVELTYRGRPRPSAVRGGPSVELCVEVGENLDALRLRVDPRLAISLISPFVERSPGLQNPGLGLDDSARGAFAAICVHLLENLAPLHSVRLARALEPPQPDKLVHLAFDVRIGPRRHWVEVELVPCARAACPPPVLGAPPELGGLLLPVPVMIGWTQLPRGAMSKLGPGATLVPGAGLFIDRNRCGHGFLAPPGTRRGWAVEFVGEGTIVLGERAVTLKDPEPGPAQDGAPTLMDVIAESPLTVRLELGCVSLPAREWALLRPGQILETGIPTGRLIDLRVANEIVATGELVDVDGQLGIEIRQIGRGER